MSNQFHVESFLDNDSETFTYVVSDPTTRKAVVIDPVLDFEYSAGRVHTTSAEAIAKYIDEAKLNVEWVLETHAHADHLSAAPFFKAKYNASIGIGKHITKVQKTFKALFNLEKEFLPNGAQFDRLFDEGDELNVGSLTFKIMHVPGHTPADIAYLLNNQCVFVGDTMFMPDVGTARCDFPGGDAATLYDSIQRILALPKDTIIYVCHDYPTELRTHECAVTVAEQREFNIHVKAGNSKADFIEMRESRDATLSMPRLILPSIQVNVRAGSLPPPETNEVRYLKIPINQL
ncbi:MBL fold metallo-hydrolase [Aliiglaciecola sp. 3_MG-2023]|uniref:MBL fold metallo-hydrolase n=1 Tax=Aliiglaciecola sp. 3_MG-2023 TaxID=3062644 RepID=UPI0026E21A64|nr:MBL fold metallo-hydrolase [Aliiglaciecola sp. 3_MG-2023]MDO6695088.1 MBL fold metallo-hydrolase [Aliiglaciecola sp. 3_MG-2023]